MSSINALGLGTAGQLERDHSKTEYIMMQRPLQRLLALRGHSIDDVVNNPIVKNDVIGYWRIMKLIDRRSEILELEQQWNQLGRRL